MSTETQRGASRSSFIRKSLMKNSEVTLEELQREWMNQGNTEEIKPTDVQQAKSIVRRHLGIKDLNEIPRKPNGDLNVTAVLRLVISKHSNEKLAKVKEWLKSDGVNFSNGLWHSVRSSENSKNIDGLDSPDENQDAGPRARRKNVKSSSNSVSKSPKASEKIDLIQIESMLDEMINSAQEANYSKVAQALREARRHVASGILSSQS